MTFLRAQWRDLLMVNWAIDPDRVSPWVPAGCDVDVFQDQTFVSLVAFRFLDTRVLGIRWPGYVDFEEVNLRLYVKHVAGNGEIRRGVVFVREIVPRRLIAWVARTLYGEPYCYLPMSHQRTVGDNGQIDLAYTWGEHRIEASASPALLDLVPGSQAEFIAEHYWGYTASRSNPTPSGTRQYRVHHPPWKWRESKIVDFHVDMAALYGPNWDDLSKATPSSVFVAEGSEIRVDRGTRLTD